MLKNLNTLWGFSPEFLTKQILAKKIEREAMKSLQRAYKALGECNLKKFRLAIESIEKQITPAALKNIPRAPILKEGIEKIYRDLVKLEQDDMADLSRRIGSIGYGLWCKVDDIGYVQK